MFGRPCTQYVQKLWYFRCSPSVMTGEPVASNRRDGVPDRLVVEGLERLGGQRAGRGRLHAVDEGLGPGDAADGFSREAHSRRLGQAPTRAVVPVPRREPRTQAGGTSSQPSRSARVASSVRDAIPNRSNSRARCVSTVFAPIPSAAADLVVGAPLDDEPHHVELAARQARAGRSPRPDAERQPARRDPPDRVEELRDRARS